MLHVMTDAYRSVESKLNDIKYIFELINKLTYYLDVKSIMPPMIIPYYYGTIPEDHGISAFVMLEGGHFTIHTFSYRECYFADLLYSDYFDSEKFIHLLKEELPCNEMRAQKFDRRFRSEIQAPPNHDTKNDFGPHLLGKVQPNTKIDLDTLFDLFESMPYDLNMDPIMRPYLLKSSKNNPKYLSGMTLIAQSHIAMHYNISENSMFVDMFSCSFTDFTKFKAALNTYFGTQIPFELIIRGSKHDFVKTKLETRISRYNAWQTNIND